MTSANDSLAAKSPRRVEGAAGNLLALVATPTPHPDSRGTVRETYRQSWFPQVPPVKQLVQSNSKANVLRGMHLHKVQWDIWRFVSDSALVRLYDHTTGDQAFLQGNSDTVIAIPPGISHGFYTRTGCILVYALTNEYDGTDEYGWYPFDGLDPIRYDMFLPDQNWPSHHFGLTISERDLRAPRLADFAG